MQLARRTDGKESRVKADGKSALPTDRKRKHDGFRRTCPASLDSALLALRPPLSIASEAQACAKVEWLKTRRSASNELSCGASCAESVRFSTQRCFCQCCFLPRFFLFLRFSHGPRCYCALCFDCVAALDKKTPCCRESQKKPAAKNRASRNKLIAKDRVESLPKLPPPPPSKKSKKK